MLALVAFTACAAGSSFSATVISTFDTIGTGEQRVLVQLRDGDGQLLDLAPEVPTATLRDENGSPLGTYPGELVWVIPDEQPAYAFVMDIPGAETYQITVEARDLGETGPAGFVAVDETIQVGVGESAPQVGGQDIPAPAIVVFASPDHCPSRSCLPMLELAQSSADDAREVGLVGVEVFVNPEAKDQEDLVLSPDIEAWGLPSQPWLYVVDADGRVAALFEGALSETELATALALVTDAR